MPGARKTKPEASDPKRKTEMPEKGRAPSQKRNVDTSEDPKKVNRRQSRKSA